jgi:uncharacterized protein YbaR (Trm112 family)
VNVPGARLLLTSRIFVISFASKLASFPSLAKLQCERSAMAISEVLLEILACPACKAKVELKADGSGLKCVKCKRVYPIREDIPVMLIDEATVEDEQPKQS